jgi:hypothetical protein
VRFYPNGGDDQLLGDAVLPARALHGAGVHPPELHAPLDADAVYVDSAKFVPWLCRGRSGHRPDDRRARLHLREQPRELRATELVLPHHLVDEVGDLGLERRLRRALRREARQECETENGHEHRTERSADHRRFVGSISGA